MKDLSTYIFDKIMQEDCSSLPVGLKGGKVGVCLFLAPYLKKRRVRKGRKLFSALFSDVLKELPGLSLGLSDGLLGVGWMIRYLSNNEILVLDENTQYLYTAIANHYMESSASFPLLLNKEDQLFSMGIYMLQLHVEESLPSRYMVDELLIKLIDECERLMKCDIGYLYSFKDMPLSVLHSILYYLLRVDEMGICPTQTSTLIEHSSELYSQVQKQTPVDDFVFRFLQCRPTNLPSMCEEKLFHFMSEIGFYSMLYDLPLLFTSTFQQYCDRYPEYEQRIKKEIGSNRIDIATLCGWGYGLLNL